MIRSLTLGAVLALAVPASADAACGVDPRKASYETPEVQVYDTNSSLRVCRRATGGVRNLGPTFFGVIPETRELTAVLGGRWVWSSHVVGSEDEEDPGSREDTLLDLRTNKSVDVALYGVNVPDVNELIAVPGAFVTTGSGGVTARFPGGRTQQLSTDAAAAGLASRGARVYWNVNGVAQSAVLKLPAAERPRARPRVGKLGRCTPRAGARLIVHDDRLVVSSVGRRVYACRNAVQRLIGNVQDVQAVSDRHVLYTGGGTVVGLFETGRGTRTELLGEEGAADGALLLAAGPTGVRTSAAELSAEPASEPALAAGRAYWLDGAGMPRTQALTS